ncbi:amidohydrolase family protein [Nocardia aobensis]|uniref:amidohydrolase family protein n=1 Tax=Nocardia aobensis TaxID=257277 RepID=UPI000688AC7C|nr:amidohydrolase family protein [Nocardia aobensis]
MYTGPVIDAFFHPGWAATTADTFGDRDSWVADPMRLRVMKTFQQTGEKPRTPEVGMDETVEQMDRAGIEQAVFQASLYYSTDRAALDARIDEHFQAVQKYPGRFAHAGTVLPPRQGPASYWDVLENPRILEEHKERYGITGVHILPSPWGTPPNEKWFYPLYAKCVELNLFVFSYIGIPGPLWPTAPNYPLHLDDVCIAFPDLVVVGHHIGDPWVSMMTHLAAKHPNLYICTSAWSPKRYPRELLEFMAGKWHGQPGADKVIFGTDYPLLDLEKAVGDARRLELDEAVIEKFMYRNMKRLLEGA